MIRARPKREIIHMRTAMMWGERSMCSQTNRKVGCVITTGDLRQILSIGYNGPARGLPDDFCTTYRARGTHEMSRCPCLHAEDNAIAGLQTTEKDKAIFIRFSPCLICAQRIVNARIYRLFYMEEYRDTEPLSVLSNCGVEVVKLDSIQVHAHERGLVEGLYTRLTTGSEAPERRQRMVSALNVHLAENGLL